MRKKPGERQGGNLTRRSRAKSNWFSVFFCSGQQDRRRGGENDGEESLTAEGKVYASSDQERGESDILAAP